jgi:glucosamine-6-phosphate deaminase
VKVEVLRTREECGTVASGKAAEILRNAIAARGHASFVAATGASQFEFLKALTKQTSIDWARTTLYHLDEYIGLPADHPASFRRYLRERLIDHVYPGQIHLIQGDAEDPVAECARLNRIISGDRIDVAFVGIGENGHLAFNDPPADFHTEEPYRIVELDEACRRQQMGEGWFPSIEDVPRRAISMSIRQIMKSEAIVCTVPEKRKAQAVKQCLEGDISPCHPASILREHPNVAVYLDKDSVSLLEKKCCYLDS